MKYFYIILTLLALTSCKKDQKGCLFNKTGQFYVDNQSKDTCQFQLIQNTDTINQTILPFKKYEWNIKAGIITKATVWRADTLYRKSRDDFKMKRCEMDGDLIR